VGLKAVVLRRPEGHRRVDLEYPADRQLRVALPRLPRLPRQSGNKLGY